VILDDVKALSDVLADEGVAFIVVGGASLERTWSVGTHDIDVAVTMADFSRVLQKLQVHRRFRNVDDDMIPIAGSEFFTGTRWTDVEFINPRPFSGTLPPDDFIDYVRRHRSREVEGIVFAEPEIVWYMRLSIPDWIVYVEKIVRDVRAGVPLEILEKVLGVSKHFGNTDLIIPRIREARSVLKIRGILE